MISRIGRRPSHTYSPQRSRHSSRTSTRGAGAPPGPAEHANAGVPGARAGPKMCCAVSHVRVSGETTTRSNAVNARPPDGRSARYARRLSACAMPLGVSRESHCENRRDGARGAARARARARKTDV